MKRLWEIPGVIDLMGAKITWKAVENRIGLHNMENSLVCGRGGDYTK